MSEVAPAQPTDPGRWRAWLATPPPADAVVERDPAARRLLVTEVLVVVTVTFGLSGVRSLLSLVGSLAATAPLDRQQVAIDRSQSSLSALDLAYQLAGILQLVAWAALGLLLLLRAGSGPRAVGLDGRRKGADAARAAGLAALIGVPGLAFYLVARAAGLNLTVVPSALDAHWWTVPVLVLSAGANAWAEEVLVVGWLLTTLRRLGLSENRALLLSALLRGSYHLYQGFGGGLGNLVMGLVFGRLWQRHRRLWPLVGAHALIDVVAFVGSALLAGMLPFL